MQHIDTTASAPRTSRRFAFGRRAAMTLGALVLASSAMAVTSPRPVAAAGGVATSYGFTCNATYHWLRNNFPNITSITGQIETVKFHSDLYKWNGSAWVFVAGKGWYAGASNGNGKLALGYLGNIPYFWVLGSGVTFDQGPVFNNLTAGYYKTAEYYQWQNGASASRWSFVNGSGAQYCYLP